MATEKQIYELIGRAVTDADFRTKLIVNTEQAAKEAGYDLTAEQIETLKNVDGKGLATVLDESLPKVAGNLKL